MQDQPVDLSPSVITTRTFRVVRKGYDPDEVQAFLTELEPMLGRGEEPSTVDAVPHADDIIRAAQDQADSMIRDAEARVAALAGVGERPATSTADGPDVGSSAEAGGDRWQDLGEHVSRVLQRAQAEAHRIVEAATARVAADTAAAATDREQAAETLRLARAEAAELTAQAEARVVEAQGDAVPRARTHVASILAEAQADLDASRIDLRAVLDQLQDVRSLVTRSLDARAELAELDPADTFLSSEPSADPSVGNDTARSGAGPAAGAGSGEGATSATTPSGPTPGTEPLGDGRRNWLSTRR